MKISNWNLEFLLILVKLSLWIFLLNQISIKNVLNKETKNSYSLTYFDVVFLINKFRIKSMLKISSLNFLLLLLCVDSERILTVKVRPNSASGRVRAILNSWCCSPRGLLLALTTACRFPSILAAQFDRPQLKRTKPNTLDFTNRNSSMWLSVAAAALHIYDGPVGLISQFRVCRSRSIAGQNNFECCAIRSWCHCFCFSSAFIKAAGVVFQRGCKRVRWPPGLQ